MQPWFRIFLVCVLGWGLSVSGGVIYNFATGVDEATGQVLADNQPDNNWIISNVDSPGDGTVPRPATVTNPEGGWNASVPIAGTGIITRGDSYQGQTTAYYYTHQFTLNTVHFTQFAMSGKVWADDQVQVLLNNNLVLTRTGDLWNTLPTTFSANNQSFFVNGLNTLTFIVWNSGSGPTGLDVIGSVTAVPEASEWVMLVGALGMAGLCYRRQLSGWWQPAN